MIWVASNVLLIIVLCLEYIVYAYLKYDIICAVDKLKANTMHMYVRYKGNMLNYEVCPFCRSHSECFRNKTNGNHLRGQFRCIPDAGPQHKLSKVVLVFFISTYDFVFRVLWGVAVNQYESH